jgi:hypothetical protein
VIVQGKAAGRRRSKDGRGGAVRSWEWRREEHEATGSRGWAMPGDRADERGVGLTGGEWTRKGMRPIYKRGSRRER